MPDDVPAALLGTDYARQARSLSQEARRQLGRGHHDIARTLAQVAKVYDRLAARPAPPREIVLIPPDEDRDPSAPWPDSLDLDPGRTAGPDLP
ncbi:hypothetical protein [Kitasatospora sp. NPDC002040]|uniref:hypothetical protein n=1 Tax=Kitasatospora sp. NPDC002040 TaxID=3154661 RepID=UPI0033250B18